MGELNGITYKWNINDFEFSLFISEVKNRFNDEGIIQIIHLNVNGFRLREGTWGTGDFLKGINSEKEYFYYNTLLDKLDINECVFTNDNMYFKINDFSDHEYISGKEYEEFNKWLITCLLPKYEGRIIKINKLKERICCIKNM